MRFAMKVSGATIRKLYLTIPLVFLSASAFADSVPGKILYVGAIAIDPCQDAKVLADWYTRFGIATEEIQGGYYGQFDTSAGPFVFGIHPKRHDAPKKCSASISVVFRVDNFERSLSSLTSKGLVPDSTEQDSQGRFAHFHDPDGNKVSIWGE